MLEHLRIAIAVIENLESLDAPTKEYLLHNLKCAKLSATVQANQIAKLDQLLVEKQEEIDDLKDIRSEEVE